MKREYHVVTPFSRFQNLDAIGKHLRDMGCIWHPLFDDTLCFRISESEWLKPVFCSKPPPEWAAPHHIINEFAANEHIVGNGRYLILCDDDWYEPEFFEKLDAVDGDILMCSMKRGDHQPPEGPQYGTSTLIAARDQMRVGMVAAEQMVLSGEKFAGLRLGPESDSDGRVITNITDNDPNIVFVPDAFVWFNYLQPGRWNK